MIALDNNTVIRLHRIIAIETGGCADLRDKNLLDSALMSAYATFGGNDLYPTVEGKAAKIGYSLIANHAFADGNKRIGMLTMLTFLELNGISLALTDDDVINAGLGVASGKTDYTALLDWILSHKQ